MLCYTFNTLSSFLINFYFKGSGNFSQFWIFERWTFSSNDAFWWFISMGHANASANSSIQDIRWLTQRPGEEKGWKDDLFCGALQIFVQGGHCLMCQLCELLRFEIYLTGQQTSGKLVGEQKSCWMSHRQSKKERYLIAEFCKSVVRKEEDAGWRLKGFYV